MNNPNSKPSFDKSYVTLRLYDIKNIAIMAAYCEEKRIDVCHLQSVSSSIANMINDLIEDIET